MAGTIAAGKINSRERSFEEEVNISTAMERLKALKGKSTRKTTYSEERRIREEVSRKYAKKYGINLD